MIAIDPNAGFIKAKAPPVKTGPRQEGKEGMNHDYRITATAIPQAMCLRS